MSGFKLTFERVPSAFGVVKDFYSLADSAHFLRRSKRNCRQRLVQNFAGQTRCHDYRRCAKTNPSEIN